MSKRMKDNFHSLLEEEQAALIQKASAELGMPDMIIEKDLWVCWLLDKIFALPVQMVFKGGTSLSKAYGLIKRFSEDCDITIDYRNFKPDLNLEVSSRSHLKKVSDQLKVSLKNYVSSTMLPHLEREVSKTFPNKKFEIIISGDGEQLKFYYPSVLSNAYKYLRDHVFIEFGVRNHTEPSEVSAISSYISQTKILDLEFPKPLINTLSPIRTFWEKATLIHVECFRERSSTTPERLSRHWYDLQMLNMSWVGKQALASNEILLSVIEHKKAFFNSAYANYDECLLKRFRLIPKPSSLEILEEDFTSMNESGMFYEPPPSFKKIIEGLSNLERQINEV
jgi:hypothetical protein